MAYEINNTFGTKLVSLADGTLDTATTDLALFGKGYAGFGEKLNENLIALLENFNKNKQLWWNIRRYFKWNANSFSRCV